LEARQLFAASAQTLLNAGYVPIQENGQQNWARQGQWMVQFEAASPARRVSKLNASLALSADVASNTRFSSDLGDQRTFLLNTAHDATMDEVRASLAGTPGIRAIERDYVIHSAAVTPNDQYFGNQWGLQQAGDYDVDAPEAWELTTGSPSVVIAVVDSGIDYNHLDLAGNIWKNYPEIAGNGIDDDANGFIDDTRGWDFVSNDNNPIDDQGHGTLIAGQIGAIGNNSIGVSGVAWQVKLMPLKFIAYTGLGASSGAIASMNYALKQKQAGVNVRAINASWVNNTYSQLFLDTIINLKANNILFVAAAGNGADDYVGDNNDAMPTYPASYWSDNIIAVAATDSADNLAGFSNYGLWTVAVGAPGVGIQGTSPNNGYAASTGTSDSAPFVSGTVALAAAAVPSADYLQIRSAIIAGADRVPSLIGKTISGGRLNARKTLDLLLPSAMGDGLAAKYFNTPDLTGTPIDRVDSNVSFDWSSNAPLPGIDRNTYSVRWTGMVMPATSENYTFHTRADDGVRLWVNGQLLISRWTDRTLANDINSDGIVNTGDFNILSSNFGMSQGATLATGDLNGDGIIDGIDLNILFGSWGTLATTQENSGTIALLAGQKYAIQLEYYQNIGRGVSRLSWSSGLTPKQIIPQSRLFSTITAGVSITAGSPLFTDPNETDRDREPVG